MIPALAKQLRGPQAFTKGASPSASTQSPAADPNAIFLYGSVSEESLARLSSPDKEFSEGADYYGRRIQGGAKYYGKQISGGYKFYSRRWSTHGPNRPANPWRDAKPTGPWYGKHLGPYSEETAGEEPVSPVDAASKRHDEEYGKIQGRYGMYGRYGAEDGSTWGVGRVWIMNYFEPNIGLHAELGAADAALVFRSWYGIGEGLWSGKYRLEYDQGWGMLLSDIVWATGITFIYAGPSALWHLAYAANPFVLAISAAVAIAEYYDIDEGWKYYGGKISEGWKYYLRDIDGGWTYHGGQLSGAWKFHGGRLSAGAKDLGGRIKGGWDYYGSRISGGAKYYGEKLSSGAQYYASLFDEGLKYYASKLSDGWDVDFDLVGGAKYYGAMVSGGSKYYGRQISEGWKYHGGQLSESWKFHGGQLSAGAKDLGGRIKGGWDYYGGRISGGSKYYGRQISEGWKYHGGQLSSAWKSAGGKLSDAWKRNTEGGGCFLTTAAVRSLSSETGARVLGTLRSFRDDYLLSSDQGTELVGKYYAIAPRIVDRIDASGVAPREYDRIYREIVLPCHQLILRGNSLAAVDIYSRGVTDLAAKWLQSSMARELDPRST